MDEHITGEMGDEKVFLAGKTVGNNINLRSEMAQEIISRKPDFMEKWALFIFIGILLLLFAATWFIRYPDIIEAPAILTAFNAPKGIVVRQDGRLIKLLVRNNEKVNRNEVFGWIESTASHEEVLKLSRQLDSSVGFLNEGQAEKVSRLLGRRFNNLGEIQQGYQTFITALQLFNDYAVNGFYARKKAMLQSDIHSLENGNQIIQNQKALTQQDIKLTEETYNMNKKLYDDKVLSSAELRVEESKMINKRMAIPQLDASLLSNETEKRGSPGN